MKRRHFCSLIISSAAGIGLFACGDDKKDDSGSGTGTGTGTGTGSGTGTGTGTGTAGPTGCLTGADPVIGTNHGHALTVSRQQIDKDIASGKDKTYTLSGSHSHTVIVRAADFAELNKKGTVTLTAQGGGHTHSVTITCK